MARTRTTIRRVDPWSVLKFAFVANLVLLGVYLLVGAVAWSFVRRLELVETICSLAQQVGIQECSVDGQALFDTMLVLGLLGVVIQTGVLVFLAFLANLIFDLVGGIAITLEDDRPSGTAPQGARRGIGSTIGTARSTGGGDRTGRLSPTGATGTPVGAGSQSAPSSAASQRGSAGAGSTTAGGTGRTERTGQRQGRGQAPRREDDDELFGGR